MYPATHLGGPGIKSSIVSIYPSRSRARILDCVQSVSNSGCSLNRRSGKANNRARCAVPVILLTGSGRSFSLFFHAFDFKWFIRPPVKCIPLTEKNFSKTRYFRCFFLCIALQDDIRTFRRHSFGNSLRRYSKFPRGCNRNRPKAEKSGFPGHNKRRFEERAI